MTFYRAGTISTAICEEALLLFNVVFAEAHIFLVGMLSCAFNAAETLALNIAEDVSAAFTPRLVSSFGYLRGRDFWKECLGFAPFTVTHVLDTLEAVRRAHAHQSMLTKCLQKTARNISGDSISLTHAGATNESLRAYFVRVISAMLALLHGHDALLHGILFCTNKALAAVKAVLIAATALRD